MIPVNNNIIVKKISKESEIITLGVEAFTECIIITSSDECYKKEQKVLIKNIAQEYKGIYFITSKDILAVL